MVPSRENRQSVPRSPLAAAARPPSIAVSAVAPQPELRRRAGCSCRGAPLLGLATRARGAPVLPMAPRTLASMPSLLPSVLSAPLLNERKSTHDS